ncbi:hypothetical protein ACFL0Q_05190 [Thermodesulfobacteriota bacterium]
MNRAGQAPQHRVAYFISPHGYGHAARAAAVMAEMHERAPGVVFEIFTSVPSWFFHDSVQGPFEYHDCVTDVGLVQRTALAVDLSKTVQALDSFFPLDNHLVGSLAATLEQKRCALVVCDISPLGIAVARGAGIRSVLVENFTWDWIYEGYAGDAERLKPHIRYLRSLFGQADHRVQTAPFCVAHASDCTTAPVSRKPRNTTKTTRTRLGIETGAQLIMITMGGIPEDYGFLEELEKHDGWCFVIPGTGQSVEKRGNAILLPHHSPFFHPDLIGASDAVIGKAGYSTLAEVYHAGVPFGFIPRSGFRESDALVAYIGENMPSVALDEGTFQSGRWLDRLPELLALPRVQRSYWNGSDRVARFLLGLMDRKAKETQRPGR